MKTLTITLALFLVLAVQAKHDYPWTEAKHVYNFAPLPSPKPAMLAAAFDYVDNSSANHSVMDMWEPAKEPCDPARYWHNGK